MRTLLIALGVATAFQLPASAQTMAITGGQVITAGPAGDLESATVVIRDGAIDAVGRDVKVPADAQVIDARGKIVAPGFVSPVSGVGLNDTVEVSDIVPRGNLGPANEVVLGFNPNSATVRRALLEGSTAAVIAPALSPEALKAGQPFAGRAAAVELSGSFDFVIKADVANVIDVTKVEGFGRASLLPMIRSQLASARRLMTEKKKDVDESEPLAALRRVLSGEQILLVDVERASDIVNVLQFAEQERIRIALVGASEGWRVAKQIAAAKVPVIIAGDLNSPETFQQLDATYQNARRLADAGVELAILPQSNLPSERNPGPVRYVAGRAVRYGLDYATAFRAITSTPARIFGIADRVGSIEAGRRADIVVWSGDPLEVSSFPEVILVRGEVIPMQSHETLLRDKYAARATARLHEQQ